jgi:hypothetical protein
LSPTRCVLVVAATIAVASAPLSGQRLSSTFTTTPQDTVRRSAAKTIALHGAVGTGAGLLIGLVLSSASTSDDETSVVVTWTALGAAAGVVSGVITWLVSGGR